MSRLARRSVTQRELRLCGDGHGVSPRQARRESMVDITDIAHQFSRAELRRAPGVPEGASHEERCIAYFGLLMAECSARDPPATCMSTGLRSSQDC